MADITAFGGTFWEPGVDRQSAGKLTLSSDGKPELRVDNMITNETTVVIQQHANGETHVYRNEKNAQAVVRDQLARTLHGMTVDHIPMTLLESHGGNTTWAGLGQEFTCRFVIIGGHFRQHQGYQRVRFSTIRAIAEPMSREDATFEAYGGGTISAYEESDKWWIEFSLNASATVRMIGSHLLLPCNTLTSIALRRPFPLMESQLRTAADSAWLTYFSHRSTRTNPTLATGQKLLPHGSITAGRLADWTDLSAKAEALVDALAGHDDAAPIEAQIITLTSICEGVDRRVYGEQPFFESLSASALNNVKKAARKAVREKLATYSILETEPVQKHIADVMVMLGKMPFTNRLARLAAVASAVDPAMLRSFKNWPASVHSVRNKIVHQYDISAYQKPLDVDETERDEKEFDLRISVAFSLIWVLKLTFLSAANFPLEIIREGLSDHEPYEYALANIAVLMENHPEGLPLQQQ
ncbi:hypothetical protein AB0J47_02665 [Nocardia sp. NPDC049737]|uniref:ApeA N-terminal domain 1-containing protein n=1 Tax=Nocardia sp. NPDC049737 TaxID=3154358 RepID=UPI003412AF6E